jgi:hypothetical protein
LDDRLEWDDHLDFEKLEPPAEKEGNEKLKKMDELQSYSLRQMQK